MNARTPLRALAALAVLASVTPSRASAASGPSERGGIGSTALSGWLVFDPGPVDGIGGGFRLTLPLTRGFIQHPRIRDEFVLEPGLDFVHYHERVGYPPYPYVSYDWNGLLFAVGGAWQVWFTPNLAVYPKIDVGYWWGWYHGWTDQYGYRHRDDFGGFFIQGAAGLIYRIDRVQLRLELGTDLFRLGVGVAI